MKIFCCFLVIFSLFSVIAASYGAENDDQFSKDVEKIQHLCMKKVNLTWTEQSGEVEEPMYEWRCFLGCVSSELGLVSRILKYY